MYRHEEVMSILPLFIDDCSRYEYAYLMNCKSETFEKFKEFWDETKNQLGELIKALRSDQREYLDEEFRLYLTDNGILSQLTAPGTL